MLTIVFLLEIQSAHWDTKDSERVFKIEMFLPVLLSVSRYYSLPLQKATFSFSLPVIFCFYLNSNDLTRNTGVTDVLLPTVSGGFCE